MIDVRVGLLLSSLKHMPGSVNQPAAGRYHIVSPYSEFNLCLQEDGRIESVPPDLFIYNTESVRSWWLS